MKSYTQYERLTAKERNEDGSAYFGLWDVELLDKKNRVGDGVCLILDKLADFEDLADDGRLLVLPCNKDFSEEVSKDLLGVYADMSTCENLKELEDKYMNYFHIIYDIMLRVYEEKEIFSRGLGIKK